MIQSAETSDCEVKCHYSTNRIYRASYLSTTVMSIYLWITILALCCYQTCSLPPIIRIGSYTHSAPRAYQRSSSGKIKFNYNEYENLHRRACRHDRGFHVAHAELSVGGRRFSDLDITGGELFRKNPLTHKIPLTGGSAANIVQTLRSQIYYLLCFPLRYSRGDF